MSLVTFPRQFLVDVNGTPRVGAKASFYEAGTDNLLTVYTSDDFSQEHTNPVLSVGGGLFPAIYIDPSVNPTYKIVITDSADVGLQSEDNVPVVGFTSTDIGSVLYPLSLAEEALGLEGSDVDVAFNYGDIRRHRGSGNNATDNTLALRTWASLAGPGMRLTLEPNGVYLFTPAAGTEGILFQNAANFVVDGNGATIKATSGATVASGCQMMYLRNVQDAEFRNFTIDGNRAARTPAEVTAHNLTVSTSCARVDFHKVRSINACCDGFYVDTQDRTTLSAIPTDITFHADCASSNSYRNNLSVVSYVRFAAIGGDYYNATGTAPNDGIDVEPGTGTYAAGANVDLVLDGCNVYGNAGWGISIGREAGATATNTRPKVRNISGSNNTLGFIRFDSVTDGEMDNIQCGAHSAATRGLIDLTATAVVGAKLTNLSFYDNTASGGTNCCLYVHSSVTGRTVIDGVKVRNTDCAAMLLNKEVDLSNVQIVDCIDGAIQVFGADSSLRNIKVDTCTGRGLYVDAARVDVDGLKLTDCASTTASADWASNATGAVLRNAIVRQRTSIPGGAVGYRFNQPPAIVQNVSASSASVDYTVSNLFTFTGGISGSQIEGCTPRVTESSGTGSISSGATTATVNHGLGVTPAAKDFCITFTAQGTNNYGRWWISGLSSTQFTVNVTSDPGASNLAFAWNVRVRP